MSTAKRFEDLEIWQLARELVAMIYEISNKALFSKDYGLKDQIRRSSVGVMNNISEGFESRTVKLFIDYLGRSKGSCGETRSVLYAALDQNYISKAEFNDLRQKCEKISSKTLRLIQYLEKYESNDRVQEAGFGYDV
ncbi:four helix bundle protein [Rhodohalobacter mucosus]|uniref:Four helix bundle protein n=1 Tax=Rhodohalobacter mucosus TaxID=2079485 RepID=A0A316TV38_9BACT|nr:four helix bundle protein [Rhodohalobacter mucosus]PWN07119.1 four helix bundle protein [Rhodohalobacter mucosus]